MANVIKLIDSATSEIVSYEEASVWFDGTPMDDSKLDPAIYRKSNGKYYKRAIAGPVNVKWFGATGKGLVDDRIAIQKAIDFCFSSGLNSLFIPQGIYLLNTQSLRIWGSNLIIQGEGIDKTILRRVGGGGQGGETIGQAGLRTGSSMVFKAYGQGSYTPPFPTYTGTTIPSTNILYQDLTVECDDSVSNNAVNGFGILLSDDILLQRVKVRNAPQTNVACINPVDIGSCGNIYFKDCIFADSKQHNFRCISYNTEASPSIGLKVYIDNCQFLNTQGPDVLSPEVSGQQLHLFVRQPYNSDDLYLEVKNSYFDYTGYFYGGTGIRNILVSNCRFDAGLILSSNSSTVGKVILDNNKFSGIAGNIGSATSYTTINNVDSVTVTNNVFPATLPDANITGNSVMEIKSTFQGIISNNKNLSLNLGAIVNRSTHTLIQGNQFIRNNKMTVKSNVLTIYGDTLDVKGNIFTDSNIAISADSTINIVGNVFTYVNNSGFSPVRVLSGAVKGLIKDNTLYLGSDIGDSKRLVLKSQFINCGLSHNITYTSAGDVSGEDVSRDSVPTTGSWQEGDYVRNITPSSNILGWVRLTTSSANVLGIDWKAIPSISQTATQADSTATDVAGVVDDLNALITKLKAAGIVANS